MIRTSGGLAVSERGLEGADGGSKADRGLRGEIRQELLARTVVAAERLRKSVPQAGARVSAMRDGSATSQRLQRMLSAISCVPTAHW